MNAEFWASIGVSVATAGAGLWAARSARRTPKQERRDDFVAITDQQGRAITRLEKRVQNGEAEIEKQRDRISDQDEAINWLRVRLRDLVGAFRIRGEEPPAARPIPERAKRILNGIDV